MDGDQKSNYSSELFAIKIMVMQLYKISSCMIPVRLDTEAAAKRSNGASFECPCDTFPGDEAL